MKSLLKDLLVNVRQIAADTSHLIMGIYIREDVQISTKTDDSPLTQADMAAHHFIIDQLSRLTPDIPILSEENVDDIDPKTRVKWSRYWLIDPLDGTKEFIAQNGEFSVNIALIDNHKPLLGVVAVPAKKVSYFAAKDLGAFKAGPDEKATPIQCRKFGSAEQGVEMLVSRRIAKDSLEKYLIKLPTHQLTAMGSSIKMCRIAEGKADIYPRFGPTSEWDTAAAQCVLEEAGGNLISMQTLKPLTYGEAENTGNPEFLAISDLNSASSQPFLAAFAQG